MIVEWQRRICESFKKKYGVIKWIEGIWEKGRREEK
jgi:hypothetical protein